MHYKEVKAILSPQNGLNIYRGCSYSCVFCDARSTCHRMDHEFEDIEVKAHAVDMLEYALKKKRTRSMIQIGSSSEPYIPLEEELQLVRRCLNQIERFDFGLVLHTHSMLALRDIDILDKINRKTKCIVIVRLSTYDDALEKVRAWNVASIRAVFADAAAHGAGHHSDRQPGTNPAVYQ